MNSRMAEQYYWDKHFPKPFFYYIDISEFINKSKDKDSMIIEGISDNNKVLFTFKLSNDSNNIKISEFYDVIKKRPIKITPDYPFNNYKYIIIGHENEQESIKNSLRYVDLKYQSNISIFPLSSNLCALTKAVYDIQLIAKFYSSSKSIQTKAWEAQKIAGECLNSLSVLYSSLFFPKLLKDEFFKPWSFYEERINNVYKLLEEFIKDLLEDFKKQENSSRILRNDLYLSYVDHQIVINNIFPIEIDKYKAQIFECKDKYDQSKSDIDKINELIKTVTENKTNTNIIKDCDVEMIDRFVKTYSSSYISYCDVMLKDYDVHRLENLLSKHTHSKYNYTLSLEKFFVHKLFIRDLKKALLEYNKDKTDFLIISQLDFFQMLETDDIIQFLETEKMFLYTLTEQEESGEKSERLNVLRKDSALVSRTFYEFKYMQEGCGFLQCAQAFVIESEPFAAYTKLMADRADIEKKRLENNQNNLMSEEINTNGKDDTKNKSDKGMTKGRKLLIISLVIIGFAILFALIYFLIIKRSY